ncbi:MAG: urease accessory protein UreH domain-containing protein [Candidatus Oleimicrobiaceae bacterium]
MQSSAVTVLLISAASIGFFHTVIGPDHYLPFVALARARKWRLRRTLLITLACGIGHVVSSVVIGAVGVAAGMAVSKVEGVETARGEVASWLLIGFGMAYAVWGLRGALRHRPHLHRNGTVHAHDHVGRHTHAHAEEGHVTPWVLFIIFVLGPCEPLIPLLMYPAATHHWRAVVGVTVVFGTATVLTMLTIVGLLSRGLLMIRTTGLERYAHAMAGAIIAISGLAIKLFGV